MPHPHPFRTAALALCVLATFCTEAGAAAPQRGEYILVSGGPALRKWEDMRAPGTQHDRWWGNFIRPARMRIQEIQAKEPDAMITWLVYRKAFVSRSSEDNRALTALVESVRDKYHVKLLWFDTGSQVINYLNHGQARSRLPICNFEYFGHSNKYCFMFDYSSDIYAVSTAWLHQADLKRIRSSAFAPNAYCQSWGCHTAEAMSDAWKKATGVWLVGAYGKTDYTDLHLRDNRVGLSSGSHWKRKG